MESNCFENSFFVYSAIPLECKTKSSQKPGRPKIGDRATIGPVGYRLKSQTDTRTKQLHKNLKLHLKLKPQLRSTNNSLHSTK